MTSLCLNIQMPEEDQLSFIRLVAITRNVVELLRAAGRPVLDRPNDTRQPEDDSKAVTCEHGHEPPLE